jgi:hypothetical protein
MWRGFPQGYFLKTRPPSEAGRRSHQARMGYLRRLRLRLANAIPAARAAPAINGTDPGSGTGFVSLTNVALNAMSPPGPSGLLLLLLVIQALFSQSALVPPLMKTNSPPE